MAPRVKAGAISSIGHDSEGVKESGGGFGPVRQEKPLPRGGLVPSATVGLEKTTYAAWKDLHASVATGMIHAQAEEIDFDVRSDGTGLLKLGGNATVNTGDIQASGDKVKVALSAKSKAVLRLMGKVRFRSGIIQATARSAKIDFGSATVELVSGDGQPATMRTLDGENESRIEATSIRFNARENSIEASKETPIELPRKPD
jgi:hypothetical protein